MAPSGITIAGICEGPLNLKTLQTKLLIGLLPTLAILVGLGLWAIVMFYRLGGNIDVILRENYTSILAAEGMKEAIERMDSGLLFAVGGRDQHGREQFDANRPRFRGAPEDRARRTSRVPGKASWPIRSSVFSASTSSIAERFFALPASRRSDGPRSTSASCCRPSSKIKKSADEFWSSTRRT